MENETLNKSISVAELSESLRKSPDEFFIIDVLSQEEFSNRHIPGAVNMPLNELEGRLSEIPKNKNVVVACKMGLMKSDKALEQLHKSGFINAKKLAGGTTGWFDFESASKRQ